MAKSIFSELVDKYIGAIIGSITEKWNGKDQEEPLLHKTMLTEEYSATGQWGSNEIDHVVVAADVVSLDSSLPLKKRGSLGTATGNLPKIGMKYRKGEKAIDDINIMIARGGNEADIAGKIFDDAAKAIKSVDIRKEIMFQQALSSGVCLVEDTDGENDGTGIRVDFGYKAENMTDAAKDWKTNTSTATPITDLRAMFDKAEANSASIGHVYLTKEYFDLMRKTTEVKELVAYADGRVITSSTKYPTPPRQRTLEALQDEFGAEFHIVNSHFRVQKHDGTFATVTPWAEGAVVGLPTTNVGRLVYGTLAEETNPVEGVSYQKSGTHILISKYSNTDPLEEFTAA